MPFLTDRLATAFHGNLFMKSWTQQTSTFLQQTLPIVSAVAPAIPLAGTPLKAAIDGLLIVLVGIKVRLKIESNHALWCWLLWKDRKKNIDDATRLMRRLRRLDTAISAALAEGQSITPFMRAQMDDLAEYVSLLFLCNMPWVGHI